MGVRAPVALRVNPDVDPETHPVHRHRPQEREVRHSRRRGSPHVRRWPSALPGLDVVGVQMHIGSQLTKTSPFSRRRGAGGLASPSTCARAASPSPLVDIGGGLGIRYRDETVPTHAEYAETLVHHPARAGRVDGPAGAGPFHRRQRRRAPDPRALPQGAPDKTFVVIDAAMNDLIRPAFYDAYHDIRPVGKRGAPRAQRRGRGRAHLRDRATSWPRTATLPRARRGRPPRRHERGRLRVRHGVELQHATPRGGGPRAGRRTTRSCAAGRRTRTWWRGRRRYDAISGLLRGAGHPVPGWQGGRGQAARARGVPRDARHGRPHPVRHHRRVAHPEPRRAQARGGDRGGGGAPAPSRGRRAPAPTPRRRPSISPATRSGPARAGRSW